jgi:hypothetical protein
LAFIIGPIAARYVGRVTKSVKCLILGKDASAPNVARPVTKDITGRAAYAPGAKRFVTRAMIGANVVGISVRSAADLEI